MTTLQQGHDPACGGSQHLPLFVGTKKSRTTRMCCVDLLVLAVGKVQWDYRGRYLFNRKIKNMQ